MSGGLVGSRERWWLVGLAVAAAVPSLLWAADGSGFIHDDWSIGSRVEFLSVWDTLFGRGTRTSARPLSAVYFELTHSLFGTHPVHHVLLLAVLNAAAAALGYVVATRLLGGRLALWTALVWVALPNRGSTRLWITMAPAVLGLCLFLVAVLLLLDGRVLAAGVLMSAAVLLYEAVAGVAVVALAVWVWRSSRAGALDRPDAHAQSVSEPAGDVAASSPPAGPASDRDASDEENGPASAGGVTPAVSRSSARAAAAGQVVAPVLLLMAATVFTYVRSPKRELDATPFANSLNVIPAQLGQGVFGPLARVGGLIVLAACTIAVVHACFPSFRGEFSSLDRRVLSGTGLVIVGSAPFFPAGFPFATDGILDRGNLVAGMGTALILGTLLAWAASKAVGGGLVVAAGIVGYVAAFNTVDLRDYRLAVEDGERLVARLDADLPELDAPTVVGPPLPNRGGVAQFIAYNDLGHALRLRRDDPSIVARIAVSEQDFVSAVEPVRYDWVHRTVSGPDG